MDFRFIMPALAALLPLGGISPMAHAETPMLLWRDAAVVGVHCLVQSDDGAVLPEMRSALCGKVAELASEGSPVPVRALVPGDPQLIASGTAALLVHATVSEGAQGRLIAFTIRPYRATAEQTSVLFGARPRAVAAPLSSDPIAALDDGIRAALGEILPWQARPQGPRPIEGRS